MSYTGIKWKDGAHLTPYNLEVMDSAILEHDQRISSISGRIVSGDGAEIFNDYENNIAEGAWSHAEGQCTTASGKISHTEGYNTTAYGECSHAEGSGTQAGENAHAEGGLTEATGARSHAEGYKTKAHVNQAHAEGNSTKAFGYNSHAEGKGTQALMDNAHSEGDSTLADGYNSHAEGYKSEALAESSHAEGRETVAEGYASHAEGQSTQALSPSSHAEGLHTITSASQEGQHVEGTYNKIVDAAIHIVGNGTNASDRKNAFVVYTDGHAELQTQGTTDNSVVIKSELDTVKNQVTSKPGLKISDGGEVFNYSGNTASGNYSHAEGYITHATASYSHAEGCETNAAATYAHAEGKGTTADGECGHAEGKNTRAMGLCSHAEGYLCVASASYAHAEGLHNVASKKGQHVEGCYANTADSMYTEAIHIVGNGESNENRSNAFVVYADGHAEAQTQGKTANSVVISKELDSRLEKVNSLLTTINNFLYSTVHMVKQEPIDITIGGNTTTDGESIFDGPSDRVVDFSGLYTITHTLNLGVGTNSCELHTIPEIPGAVLYCPPDIFTAGDHIYVNGRKDSSGTYCTASKCVQTHYEEWLSPVSEVEE